MAVTPRQAGKMKVMPQALEALVVVVFLEALAVAVLVKLQEVMVVQLPITKFS